jgi:hypothetical protein
MSILSITTTISHKWLERKSKRELASIIMANIDRVSLFAELPPPLEVRVAVWVKTRLGPDHMQRRERAMRLLEEAIELAQAEGLTIDQVVKQADHVFMRPAGEPSQEAAGVAVTLLAWCAATGNTFADLGLAEIERIEAKPLDQIRGSLARKEDADLVMCAEKCPACWGKGIIVMDHGNDTRECRRCKGTGKAHA